MPSTPQAVTETLFWMSVAVLLYAYAGYPVLMGLLSRVAGRRKATYSSSNSPRNRSHDMPDACLCRPWFSSYSRSARFRSASPSSAVSALLLVYLCYALVKPERF